MRYDSLKAKGIIDSLGNLTPQYDAATANWGDGWRMPTIEEIKELLTLENKAAELNGIKGRLFIGKNGNILFLPFAGGCFEDGLYDVGGYGSYWSATAFESVWHAHSLNLYLHEANRHYYVRRYGQSVRPVKKTK